MVVEGHGEFVLAWGRNELSLPVGTYPFRIWIPWKPFRFGPASDTMTTREGQTVEITYQAAVVPGTTGSLRLTYRR
ncbi:hypothetical protein [Micromonospora sp. NPDC005305]|uniref:hypothetical protein n=1 Tax=Micromonospora sp. NPDC005305 TaxID=3156875 RepID=UPI00339F36C3